MEKSNKDQVEAAFGHATMEASAFMVELARDRAAARNERDLALDDRATQLAAIQFAAAAVGATIAGDRAPIIVIIVAAIASATFAVGGIWALRAARPDQVHLPGIPPLWWRDCVKEPGRFDRHAAIVWAAGAIQHGFEQNTGRAAQRVKLLNTSLAIGIAGAVLVAIAAFCKLLPPDPPAHPTEAKAAIHMHPGAGR